MPSSSAAEELLRQGLDLNDIKEILERGFDCARSKRKAGTLEKCIIVGDWLRKAVVIEKADRWLITHAGMLKFSKTFRRRFEGKW